MDNQNDRYRVAPEAFSLPDGQYLGNPDTVAALVGGFAARVEALVGGLRHTSADVAKAELWHDIRRMADIVSGRDPSWQVIKGYHDHSLAIKLMADLGPYWQQHRARWGDDAVAVLFDWLAAIVMEKTRLADGDDMLLGVMLRPSMQYATKVILGIEERVTA